MEFIIGGVILAAVALVAYKKWPWFKTETDLVIDKVETQIEKKDATPAANTGS